MLAFIVKKVKIHAEKGRILQKFPPLLVQLVQFSLLFKWNTQVRTWRRVGYFLGSIWTVIGASAQQPSLELVSDLYHNTTSYYNALFIARQTADAIAEKLRSEEFLFHGDILPIYPHYDTVQMLDLQEEIVDLIKKSSLILQYHPKSTWTDEAYLLLGKGRYYHNEPKEAVKALKYLSGKGKKKRLRQAAQIALLRLYTRDTLLAESKEVLKYLVRNPPRTSKNRLNYLLSIAYLAQRLGRTKDVIRYLGHAESLAKKKYLRTRIFFILGQCYEAEQNDSTARYYYRKCVKKILPYPLYLEAWLRAMACSRPKDEKALKKARKRLRRQVRELKNKDFRYKIHFHWARMEEKIGNSDEAQQHYVLSTSLNSNDAILRGRAYEKLASSSYVEKKIELAAEYYAKAKKELPSTATGYKALARRSAIFERIAKHYKTRDREDSLLWLSQLPEDTLSALLRAKQAGENARLKQAKAAALTEKLRNEANPQANAQKDFRSLGASLDKNSWYFYDKEQLEEGRKWFMKTWSRRILSDGWRTAGGANGAISASLAGQNEPFVDNSGSEGTEKETTSISLDDLRKDIPKDTASRQAAHERLQNAYYGIGSIYYFELEEEKEAGRQAFMKLIERYPQSLYRARLLYLLAKDEVLSDSARMQFSSSLRASYPDSVYTKLLDNPNYLLEQAAAVRELQKAYKTAYALHKKKDYQEAQNILKAALAAQFEPNSFTDNALLLDILLDAKLQRHHRYQYKLSAFLALFSESELVERVRTLLKGARDYQKERKYSSLPRYSVQKSEEHALIWTCRSKKVADTLSKVLQDIAPSQEAPPRALFLGSGLWMVLLPYFSDAEEAMKTYARWVDDGGLQKQVRSVSSGQKIAAYAINQRNLSIIFAAKDIAYYRLFFKKHYLK